MKTWAAVGICMSLVACDPMHAPYVRNETTSPAALTLTYANQPSPTTGTLAPRTNLGHSEEGKIITRLEARIERGPVFILDQNELAARRAGRKDNFEFWLITDEGVLLKSKQEWEQRR